MHVLETPTCETDRYATVTDRYVRYACPDLYADASGGLGPRGPLRFLFFVSCPPPPPRGVWAPHSPRTQSRTAQSPCDLLQYSKVNMKNGQCLLPRRLSSDKTARMGAAEVVPRQRFNCVGLRADLCGPI